MKKYLSVLIAAFICVGVFSLYGCNEASDTDSSNAATADSAPDALGVSGDDLVINTSYGSLYYPLSWQEQFDYQINTEGAYTVKFMGKLSEKNEVELFSIVFAQKDKDSLESTGLLGSIKDKDVNVYLSVNDKIAESLTESEKNTFFAMQEELNYTTSKLTEINGYESAGQ